MLLCPFLVTADGVASEPCLVSDLALGVVGAQMQ
jgi:hypothetical protein